ncbi:MAG TPA: chromosome segregation protein SMC [Lacipirellulaceae bacterium]|nr:chromosome segregation protein SMC [Lacipirellulaceae bacterium]
MLSALELNGFKSFADRTRLEFPPGITVVVGPNGSGKSNIVDAMKWVLGSQSVKSLRGKEMTDVIFSGSRSRRQGNAAEASLVFDNSSGQLDHDAREIQLTRRVYRSGEVEYLLNRQPCRLRDLRDLLAGAGVSTSGYCIIEQGRVDAVLQASAKERRLIFEEAAGISRFRLKREEAARRLERVQQNLLRLGDIVDELQSRLKTVRTQAAKAHRYTELSQRVEQLRTMLGLADWHTLSAQIARRQQAIAQDEAAMARLTQSIAEYDLRVAAIDAAVEALDSEQRAALAHEGTLRERLAQCESTRGGQLARVDELEQEVVRLSHQVLMLTSRAGDSQQLVADTDRDLQASRGALAVFQNQAAALQGEAALLEGALTAAKADVESAAAELEAARRLRAEIAADRQLVDAKLAGLEAALAARDEEGAPLARSCESLAQQAKLAAAKFAKLASQLETANADLQAAQNELAQNRASLSATQRRAAELSGRLTGASERTAVLEELESRLDGLAAGAKEVLRRARDEPEGPFRSVRGVVADLLHVDADTAPLVEIALGERANYLVIDETKTLAAALAAEPSSWPGRTTFLRLDVPHPASAVDRVDLSGEPGVMGRADSFVETAADLAPMVRRLLGRYWLVDAFATAAHLAAGVGRGLNFVTLAGEALLADGTLAVGPRQSTSGMLSRRSELRALRDEVEVLRQARLDAEREELQLETRIAQWEAALGPLAANHEALSSAASELRVQSASLAERHAEAQARLDALSSERSALAQQIALHRAQHEQSSEDQRQLAAREDGALALSAAACQRRDASESQLTDLQRTLADVRVELARGEQRVEGLERQMEQLARDHAERDRALAETRSRAEQCQSQRTALQQSAAALAEEIAELQAQRAQFGASATRGDQQRRALQADRGALVQDADALRAEAAACGARIQAAQLELQQHLQQRTTLVDRLREDYQLDLEASAIAAGETPAPCLGAAERAAAEAEIRELRDRIQAGGPVNLESLEELQSLEGRSGGLLAQYEDLQQARARLEQIVQQINGESRQLFLDAVTEVRGHFQDIFRRLFAGGEADILLEEDEGGDVLECGVSIVARPPGKQPRNISLLSGGERTLTCVALLLAIFRSRPSPFCVLDEVDAALDEANIDRFVGLLKEFNTSTQFIVITHSKRTMTCADTLHGVTMQESGVSKRVSVRFEDVGEDGRIRASALQTNAADAAGDAPRSRAA